MADPVNLTLVGATGLVGRAVMEEMVGRPDFRFTAIARREVPLPKGARMEMRLAPVDLWDDVLREIRPEIVVCALGTTWRKAGRDEEAFRAVDEALVLKVAATAKEAGARHFITVSSAGANSAGRNFYLRVKGETENALGRMQFRRLDILQPGMLLGTRQGDLRLAEGLTRLASLLVDLALRGSWRKFHSISAQRLAQAIVALAREKAAGRFFHDHDSLMRAAHRLEVKDRQEQIGRKAA
ncbi:NAD(P)H-binding protein [Altererythrobacter sp. CC-YST694]|uniref:NAD(P)H-binding protein n=1 Tax=Altererythrobacter sp. CC-YST694 TaxID=2755038 RepID=UPI001D00424B|nr:NAD(P)H-binding protein [Altererythrobacter sp. CC-YST694]MCB5424848.1 NAD(P)H-binding protein [Altererythrobacter sp. CC-YST694]